MDTKVCIGTILEALKSIGISRGKGFIGLMTKEFVLKIQGVWWGNLEFVTRGRREGGMGEHCLDCLNVQVWPATVGSSTVTALLCLFLVLGDLLALGFAH